MLWLVYQDLRTHSLKDKDRVYIFHSWLSWWERKHPHEIPERIIRIGIRIRRQRKLLSFFEKKLIIYALVIVMWAFQSLFDI